MALSDRIIEAKVREALNLIYQGVHSRNILPRNVYNGKVILTGTSPAKSIIKEAIDTAAQIEGVTEVESEIIETSAIIGNV